MYGDKIVSVVEAMEEMIDESSEFDNHKHDYEFRIGGLAFNEECRVILPRGTFGTMQPVKPTEWAMGQLCSRLGESVWPKTNKSLPMRYFYDVAPGLAAHCLNRHIEDYPDQGKSIQVRAYKETARAFLSGIYGIADNTPLLQETLKIIQAGGTVGNATSVRSYVNPDGMTVKIVLGNKGTPDGPYGIGFSLSNGEIGNGSITIRPMIQRHSCTNSIVFSTADNGFKRKHTGSKQNLMAMFRMAAYESIEGMLVDGAAALDAMVKASRQRIGSFDSILDKLGDEYGWSQELKIVVARGTENRETLAGLVNGISYAGHNGGLDAEEGYKMEVLAGHILTHPQNSWFRQSEPSYLEREE